MPLRYHSIIGSVNKRLFRLKPRLRSNPRNPLRSIRDIESKVQTTNTESASNTVTSTTLDEISSFSRNNNGERFLRPRSIKVVNPCSSSESDNDSSSNVSSDMELSTSDDSENDDGDSEGEDEEPVNKRKIQKKRKTMEWRRSSNLAEKEKEKAEKELLKPALQNCR